MLSDAIKDCLWRSLLPLLIASGVAAAGGNLTCSTMLLLIVENPLGALPSKLTTGEVLLLLVLWTLLPLPLPPALEAALDDLLLVFNFMVGFTAAQISQVVAVELLMKVHASQDQPCVSGGFEFDCDLSIKANSL